MKIVLRIGGSALGSAINSRLLKSYATVISKLVSEGNSVAIFVGGGPAARNKMKLAKRMGLNQRQQHIIGIETSRRNAKLLALKLGIDKTVPTSVDEMVRRLKHARVEVMGGTVPGTTTDLGAMKVAERWKADIILKGSDQEGIYTADPRKHKGARKLDRITHARMKSILKTKIIPGMHSIVDPMAVSELARSKIKLIVFNGSKPSNVLKAVHGGKVGTLVVSE